MRGRTLHSTLSRWLALAFALGIVVLGAGTVLARKANPYGGQDDELAARAERLIAGFLAQGGALEPAERMRAAGGGGPGYWALRDESGEVLASWNAPSRERLPPLSPAAAGPLTAAFRTLDPPDDGDGSRVRSVTMPFRESGALYFLQVALPARKLYGSLGALVLLFGVGVVLLGFGMRVAARLIVGSVLSPVRTLAEAAREVSPSTLARRFRVRTADTELRRLEEELNAALQRIEEGYRTQAQFASNVAHELKTPIATLVTDAQVSRLGRRSLEKSYAFIGRAESELRHLGELVESFLVMARVDAHEGRNDLVYVDDVVRGAVGRCEYLATKRGVALRPLLARSPAGDSFVRGDSQLLQAMVENLIRNAIGHSPRGAPVVIEARVDAESVRILVHDRGPGIPEQFRQVVFERGVRATDLGLGYGGAGLGLSIASSVAELHRGGVTVEENEHGGASFVVTLPVARDAAESRAGAVSERRNGG